MQRVIASGLIVFLICAAWCSTAANIEYTNWPGDFGELVRLHENGGLGATPKDSMRIIELLGAQGQYGDAIRCGGLLTQWDDFKKEPWAGLLSRKMEDLKARNARAANALRLCPSALARLKAKLPPCHIEETDLPQAYRQEASEERLHSYKPETSPPPLTAEEYPPLTAEECPPLTAEEYPIMTNFFSLSRVWKSTDGTKVAFLAYADVGPSLVYSLDGGRNWLGPLYVGMHRLPHHEYHILWDSKLPLLDGQRLQFEVTIWIRDQSKPGSALTGYSYLGKQWHKMLSVPLDVLAKDSDGDGLSDLFEERILTDPNSADSDGDGLEDGVDNQALVPFPGKLSDSDRIILALAADNAFEPLLMEANRFSELTGYSSGKWSSRAISWLTFGMVKRPIQTSMHLSLTKAGMERFTMPSRTLIPPTKTSLIHAEVPVFGGITGGHRWLVLNGEEMGLYREKFGDNSSVNRLTPFAVDSNGCRAFLRFQNGMYDRIYILQKQDGQWMSRRISEGVY